MDIAAVGTYRIATLTPSGETMWISGRFSRVEPTALLTYSWAMEPIDKTTQHSEIEVPFDETPEGTLVTVVQTRIASPEARETHLSGWIGCSRVSRPYSERRPENLTRSASPRWPG